MTTAPAPKIKSAGPLRSLALTATFLPSLSLIGAFNALPFGYAVMPFLALGGYFRYYKKFLILSVLFMLTNLLILPSMGGMLEAFKILYGPFLVLLWAQHTDRINIRLIDFCVLVFIIDGILGQTTGVRNLSIITNEPSHSARFMFMLGVYYILFFERREILLRLGMLFVALLLNGSLTAIGMGLLLVPLFLRLRLVQYGIAMILVVLGIYLLQKYADLSSLPRLQHQLNRISSYNGTDFYQTLYFWGGPRLTLSIFAFLNAPWIGAGLGQDYNLVLISAENLSTLHGIDFLVRRDFNNASSYMSQLLFEFGLAFSLAFIALFCLAIARDFRLNSAVLLFLGLLQLFFFSSTLMPTGWILIGLALRSRAPARRAARPGPATHPRSWHPNSARSPAFASPLETGLDKKS